MILVGYNCQCQIKGSCAKCVEQEEDFENGKRGIDVHLRVISGGREEYFHVTFYF